MPIYKRKEKTVRITLTISKELFFRVHTMESVRAVSEGIGRNEILKEALTEFLDKKGY